MTPPSLDTVSGTEADSKNPPLATANVPLSPYAPDLTLFERHCRVTLYSKYTGIPRAAILDDIRDLPHKEQVEPAVITRDRVENPPVPEPIKTTQDSSVRKSQHEGPAKPAVVTRDTVKDQPDPEAFDTTRYSSREEMLDDHDEMFLQITSMTRQKSITVWKAPTLSNIRSYINHVLGVWGNMSLVRNRELWEDIMIRSSKRLLRSISPFSWEKLEAKLEAQKGQEMSFCKFLYLMRTVVPLSIEEYDPCPSLLYPEAAPEVAPEAAPKQRSKSGKRRHRRHRPSENRHSNQMDQVSRVCNSSRV